MFLLLLMLGQKNLSHKSFFVSFQKMSRHRDVRNLDAEDFESDYDYGSSYSGNYLSDPKLRLCADTETIYYIAVCALLLSILLMVDTEPR